MKSLLLVIKLFVISNSALAGIPPEYSPLVLKAPFSFSERVFDLTNSVDVARAAGKNIFLYLGAEDCPPCKEYEFFLRKNHQQLKDDFSKVVVVELQTWLRGPERFIKLDNEKIPLKVFKERMGDKNKSVVYPSYWILSNELKMIRQLPQGNKEFLDINRHREFMR